MTSSIRSMFVLLLLALLTVPTVAQKKSAAAKKTSSKAVVAPQATFDPQTVLATVGTESVRLGEVERAFQKNLTRRAG
ncbi:MAG: hypothetical protein ACK47W_06510 [Bacteroidota bacterium]